MWKAGYLNLEASNEQMWTMVEMLRRQEDWLNRKIEIIIKLIIEKFFQQ